MALYILGLVPVWFASATLFLGLWPWRAAVSYLALLWLLGIALTELCFSCFYKIPFTCLYTPGRSQANMAVLGFLGLLFLTLKAAENRAARSRRFGELLTNDRRTRYSCGLRQVANISVGEVAAI